MKISVFSDLPIFGEGKEKKTLERISEHVRITLETVSELECMLSDFSEGLDVYGRQKRIDGLEKAADMLRREIEEDLYSGAFLPLSRSRILDFAENVDKIADAAEDSSKILLYFKREEFPEELLPFLKEAVCKAIESIKLLKEATDNIEDLERVRTLIREIRLVEHESDEIAEKAYNVLYRADHSGKVLILLSKLIECVSRLSDTTEDASDSLSLIVLMHKI